MRSNVLKIDRARSHVVYSCVKFFGSFLDVVFVQYMFSTNFISRFFSSGFGLLLIGLST